MNFSKIRILLIFQRAGSLPGLTAGLLNATGYTDTVTR